MGIYEDLGVPTAINVAGAATRMGGALMPPEVVEAMSAAALESVAMDQLQAAASRLIARSTGAEAGYVTSGASAALTLGTAAILAGLDIARMERLPDTTGMKNEFIISREHRNGYDHAVRLAGARLVEVGMNEQLAGAGVRRTEPWEYEAVIGENTAGIVYFFTPDSQPPLESVIEVAHKHGLPVLVDAAAQLPPVSNLRHFVAIGADLVAFSGGKAIRGPQATGILCGRRNYIASVALQHLDLDEYYDTWNPPQDLIPKDSMRGFPRHGIGRGFKVSKENIVGLAKALELFSQGAYQDHMAGCREHLEYIADRLSGLPVRPEVSVPQDGGYPTLSVILDTDVLGRSAFQVADELKRGSPAVFVNERLLTKDALLIHPINLTRERAEAVAARLRQVLGSK